MKKPLGLAHIQAALDRHRVQLSKQNTGCVSEAATTTIDGSTQTEMGGRKRKFVSKYDIPTSISALSRESMFESSFCQVPEIHLPASQWPLLEESSDDQSDSEDELRFDNDSDGPDTGAVRDFGSCCKRPSRLGLMGYNFSDP